MIAGLDDFHARSTPEGRAAVRAEEAARQAAQQRKKREEEAKAAKLQEELDRRAMLEEERRKAELEQRYKKQAEKAEAARIEEEERVQKSREQVEKIMAAQRAARLTDPGAERDLQMVKEAVDRKQREREVQEREEAAQSERNRLERNRAHAARRESHMGEWLKMSELVRARATAEVGSGAWICGVCRKLTLAHGVPDQCPFCGSRAFDNPDAPSPPAGNYGKHDVEILRRCWSLEDSVAMLYSNMVIEASDYPSLVLSSAECRLAHGRSHVLQDLLGDSRTQRSVWTTPPAWLNTNSAGQYFREISWGKNLAKREARKATLAEMYREKREEAAPMELDAAAEYRRCANEVTSAHLGQLLLRLGEAHAIAGDALGQHGTWKHWHCGTCGNVVFGMHTPTDCAFCGSSGDFIAELTQSTVNHIDRFYDTFVDADYGHATIRTKAKEWKLPLVGLEGESKLIYGILAKRSSSDIQRIFYTRLYEMAAWRMLFLRRTFDMGPEPVLHTELLDAQTTVGLIERIKDLELETAAKYRRCGDEDRNFITWLAFEYAHTSARMWLGRFTPGATSV
jgi:rubrerythrin